MAKLTEKVSNKKGNESASSQNSTDFDSETDDLLECLYRKVAELSDDDRRDLFGRFSDILFHYHHFAGAGVSHINNVEFQIQLNAAPLTKSQWPEVLQHMSEVIRQNATKQNSSGDE